MDILALFQCLGPHVTATTLRQFSRITRALLVMTGRITMRGLARWAGQGGSYHRAALFLPGHAMGSVVMVLLPSACAPCRSSPPSGGR